jgi:uncharacterized membrane protein (UPF0182 family)
MALKDYLGIALIAVFLVFPALMGVYIDYLWFQEVGYTLVFLKVLKTKLLVGLAGGLFFLLLGYANLVVALRNSLRARGEPTTGIGLTFLAKVLVILFALLMGLGTSVVWETVLKFFNAGQFGLTDPIFNRDIGFYLFILPFYNTLQSVLLFGLVLVTGVTAGFYFLYGGALTRVYEDDDEYSQGVLRLGMPSINRSALAHISVLAGFIFLVLAAGYLLDRFSILYSERGEVFGAGYTDITVSLPLFSVLATLSLVVALLFFMAAWTQRFSWPGAGIALLLLINILGNSGAGLVQQYQVAPNEFNLERPYLENNIHFTRLAYDLDRVQEVEFPARYELTAADIENNAQTIDNIRLWDWRPLLDTYKQIQLIRTYYDFADVDIDRYTFEGTYKQVMLSPRELNYRQVPDKTWTKEHMFYTHGYGLAMSPVRKVSKEGLPELYIRDIPPKSDLFTIERPEIYFGELTDQYILVKTTTEELDYPKGDKNVHTTYQGEAGVELSSTFRKAAMATRFNTLKLLVSTSIKPDSRIIFRRDIKERVRTIAPFLLLDSDPYMVVSEGKLYWILDGYTVSDKFPYSEPSGRINYIRNSVKVTVDAYNGKTNFYIVTHEPVIDTYARIFPGLFKEIDQMPEDLKRHLRYPEDLFKVQAEKYAVYHMQDPRVFYTKEDVYVVPQEIYENSQVPMEPYYLIMKLPGEEKEEFILLLPFIPVGQQRNNMIAWMAARMDPPHYGERVVYVFPKDKLIFGPSQIEARIDQDPDISQLFTLWGQAGSRIIRGNLLVIPIEDSLLYVEPIYIKAEQSGAIPELKRVIVAFGDQLTMQETLEEALAVIFKGEVEQPAPVEPAGPGEEVTGRTTRELIEEAVRHYELAQSHLQNGSWTGFGEEMEEMRKILEELRGR